MATIVKIWQKYVFGNLDPDIKYFTPTGNALVYYYYSNGKKVKRTISNPSEAQMNAAGWYRVVNVAEDGTDAIIDNILYHYTGAPIDEPIDEEEPTED